MPPAPPGEPLWNSVASEPDVAETFGLGLAEPKWDGLAGRLAGRPDAIQVAVTAGLLKTRGDGSPYDVFRNRLVFPICDELGSPIAFGGRIIDPEDTPKYLNSPESPLFNKSRTLYALHLAKRAIIEVSRAIITEGYTDVIACHQSGVTNVVGTLGTALTREHARVLSRLCNEVVLVFDGDAAGQKAAERGVEVFFHEPVDVRICVLPNGADPDDLLRQPDGVERFQAAVDQACSALEFMFRRFRAEYGDQATVSGREKVTKTFLARLGDLGVAGLQGVRKRAVLSQVADLLDLPVDDVQRLLPRPRGAAAGRERTSAATARPVAPEAASTLGASRARRLAEHALLALLIYEPALLHHPVPGPGAPDAGTAPVAIAFSPALLVDPAAARIATTIYAAAAEGTPLSVQQLHAALADDDARRLASDLYFDGDRRCQDADPATLFEAAAAALDRRIADEAYHDHVRQARSRAGDSPEAATAALEELLKQRRQRETVPSAISLGARG